MEFTANRVFQSSQLSVVRLCVASGLAPDVKGNVARIRRPFVASEPVSDVKDNFLPDPVRILFQVAVEPTTYVF